MSGEIILRIEAARDEAISQIEGARDPAELALARVHALGKKAPLSQMKSSIGSLSAEDKPLAGRTLQEALAAVEASFSTRLREMEAEVEAESIAADRVDVTLPGRGVPPGHPHPISLMLDRITDVFVAMGYRVAEGPEVENDWYNFEALNMPLDHAARSMWDTLYIRGAPTMLRTHTSPVQIRAMERQQPPIYIISPGRCARRDAFDATHSPVFHQVEGLAVDRGITFADLKGTLNAFVDAIYGAGHPTRFRPSYFPFTEPSAELDMECPACDGRGCSACGRSGWVELLGCGMVHPKVLQNVGYDPEIYTGFAFGMGIERSAMRAFEIPDMRQLFDNDVRFLARFAG